MTDIADKIYAATGLTLNAEAAAAIGQMIQQAKRDALAEAAVAERSYVTVCCGFGIGSPPECCTNGIDAPDEPKFIAAAIRALGEKE